MFVSPFFPVIVAVEYWHWKDCPEWKKREKADNVIEDIERLREDVRELDTKAWQAGNEYRELKESVERLGISHPQFRRWLNGKAAHEG